MLTAERVGLIVLAGMFGLFAVPAFAIPIGDIQACYARSNNFPGGGGNIDAVVFEIKNTSSNSILNAMFTANGDTYNIGTIAAGANIVLTPGVSNDGGTHTGFWAVQALLWIPVSRIPLITQRSLS